MTSKSVTILAGCCLLFASPLFKVGPLALAETSDEQIAARQAGYKHMGEIFGDMKKAVESGADVTPFAPRAEEIVAWGRKIPTLFPPGTEQGHNTKARPEIWSDRDGFNKASTVLVAEAGKLAQVAQTGDKSAFAAQFKATGAACGGCHRSYRYRES